MPKVKQENMLEVLKWKDIKSQCEQLRPQLTRLINNHNKADACEVVRIRYNFGQDIIRDGVFFVNLNGDNVPITDARVPKSVQKLLDYYWASIPFGMVLKNGFESCFKLSSHIVANRQLSAGDTFSLLGIFDNPFKTHMISGAYSAVAGSRSLFCLPKLSQHSYAARFERKYGFPTIVPKTFDEQWQLFRAISQSKAFESDWHVELILFSKEFIKIIDETPDIKNLLLGKVWQGTSFLRNQPIHELLWSSFIDEHYSLSVKNSTRIIETFKHIIKMIIGEVPAFMPAETDTAGPITDFMSSILDVYKIRYYMPIFMQLTQYQGQSPVYYSLHKHTFFHNLNMQSNSRQTINEMHLIAEMLNKFKELMYEDRLPFSMKGTSIYYILNNLEIDFFHPKGEGLLRKDIETIPDEDARFNYLAKQIPHDKDLTFPDKSVFFNGCIRIRPSTDVDVLGH